MRAKSWLLWISILTPFYDLHTIPANEAVTYHGRPWRCLPDFECLNPTMHALGASPPDVHRADLLAAAEVESLLRGPSQPQPYAITPASSDPQRVGWRCGPDFYRADLLAAAEVESLLRGPASSGVLLKLRGRDGSERELFVERRPLPQPPVREVCA